jgi:hypothetical protein
MATTTLESSKEFIVPDSYHGKDAMAQCAYCDYQTQCKQVAVCKDCFTHKLKLSRPERQYSYRDTRERKYKSTTRDSWTRFYRSTTHKHYVQDFNKPAKYTMFPCVCSMCGSSVWSEYTIPVCQSCTDSFETVNSYSPRTYSTDALDKKSDAEELPYRVSTLTSRFPANSLNHAHSKHPGPILDVVPIIASFLLFATSGDIEEALCALLNLMDVFQDLISPQVIIRYIRDNSPVLYSAWHDFLLCMKYDANLINQVIPSSFGYVCCVKRSEELAISEWDIEYQGTCECSLKRLYFLGCNMYPPSHVLDGSWRVADGYPEAIHTLAEELITEHTNKHVTAAVQTCMYMNNANYVDSCLDGSLAMQTTKRDLRTPRAHPNDLARPKKADRKARLRAARHIPGKTKRPNYNFGNYSLVN